MSVLKIKPTPKGEGGTTVVANPELVGTEPNLTGLEVSGTKYKVPEGGSGGTSMYLINVYCDDSGYIQEASLFVDDNTLETYEDLFTYLVNKGCFEDPDTEAKHLYPVSAYRQYGQDYNVMFARYGAEEHLIVLATLSENNDTYFINDGSFSITYLGNN